MQPTVSLPNGWPILPETTSFENAQAALEAADLSDGLPLVPPTATRLAAMLSGVTDPMLSHGAMPPLFGNLTTAAVAYNCVLAGCRAAELPLVLTAAISCLEPDFNLLGLMTTTGSAAVAMIVHGPIAARLGLNASINCMGPGNRANATIGRALSLCLRNIGGAKAGSGDMATVGQPAKYGLCFAEGIESDVAPLHVRRGFKPADDAVTVLGISGTAEVLPVEGRDTPDAILDPIAVALQGAFRVNGASKQPAPPEQVFVLPPELAGQIRQHDWDLARIQSYLFEASRIDGRAITPAPADILPVVSGGPGVKIAHLPLWGGGTRTVTRAVLAL